MTIYDFMSDSPWLAFFLSLIIAELCKFLVGKPLRHMSIRKHGWPPNHCDSDGEFSPVSKSKDTNDRTTILQRASLRQKKLVSSDYRQPKQNSRLL